MLLFADCRAAVDEAQLALSFIGQTSVGRTVFLSKRSHRLQSLRKACGIYRDDLGQLLNTVRIELLHTAAKHVGTVAQLLDAIDQSGKVVPHRMRTGSQLVCAIREHGSAV